MPWPKGEAGEYVQPAEVYSQPMENQPWDHIAAEKKWTWV
jgi:hypothetical protein